MWISNYEYEELSGRVKKLEKALTCYGDLAHEKDYVLSAEKIVEKLRELEQNSIYYSGSEYCSKTMGAKEIMKRFTELYSLLSVDRVDEPSPTLRKRA